MKRLKETSIQKYKIRFKRFLSLIWEDIEKLPPIIRAIVVPITLMLISLILMPINMEVAILFLQTALLISVITIFISVIGWVYCYLKNKWEMSWKH